MTLSAFILSDCCNAEINEAGYCTVCGHRQYEDDEQNDNQSPCLSVDQEIENDLINGEVAELNSR